MILSHDGSMGDLLAHMHFAVELSESLKDPIEEFIIQTDVPMKWAVPNHPNGNVNMTKAAAEFVKPLVESCGSIRKVTISDKIPETCVNISKFRDFPLNFSSGSMKDWPYELCKFHLPHGYSRKLFDVEADDKLKDKIIFIRTERYNNVKFDIGCLEPFKDSLVMVGLPREHNLFEKHHFKVDYIPLNDALEAAQLMLGAKGVIGNQSGLFWVAEMVKAKRILIPCQFQNYQRNGKNYVIPGPCNVICDGGWHENASSEQKLVSLVNGMLD